MSYYLLKNIKLDKKNNKISCEMADSSLRDCNNNYIYTYTNSLYDTTKYPTFEEQYAHFIYDIVVGNLHFENKIKYSKMVCTFDTSFEQYYNYCKDLIMKNDPNAYLRAYTKYQSQIENTLKPKKKEYIINLSTKYYQSYLVKVKKGYYKQNGTWVNGFYTTNPLQSRAKVMTYEEALDLQKLIGGGKIENVERN